MRGRRYGGSRTTRSSIRNQFEIINDSCPEDNIEISSTLGDNLVILQEQFRECGDIVIQNLTTSGGVQACMIYVGGLINNDLIQRDVLPVLLSLKQDQLKELEGTNLFPSARFAREYILEKVIDNVLKAYTVILLDGISFALCFETDSNESRPYQEPEVERILKGQHDGFVEAISKNIALIRRKIASSKLKARTYVLGKRSKGEVAMLYIEDIANPDIVEQVGQRLENIEIDYINGAGIIEQLTTDNPYSLFPLYHSTERADKAVANLMEGRILILVDHTPVSLIVPVSYFQFFQTPEDYNINFIFGSFLRLLRFAGSSAAILIPALYIALLTYHYQAVPLNLLVPLAESRARVPFPPIIEALIMELAFELLREASIRLPQGLGPTVGIVGGLALGQTAVEAGIVSNVMVVLVGLTAIATFVVPHYDMGWFFRMSRFIAMINAAIFGVAGIMIFSLFTLAHMVTLESCGQPYLQPLAPFNPNDFMDTFIRAPMRKLRRRPDVALPKDKTRGRGNVGEEQR